MNTGSPEKRIVPCPSCASLNRVPTIVTSEPKCGKCSTALDVKSNVFEVAGAALSKIVLNSPLPVVCDFWAPWCGPCLAFAPTFQQYAGQHNTQAIFLKCDTEANGDVGATFNIRSIPTLIVFANEKEKVRQSGALPLPQLNQWLQPHLA